MIRYVPFVSLLNAIWIGFVWALPAKSAERCNIEDHTFYDAAELASFDSQKILLTGLSSEGGEAELFRDHGRLREVRASLYGETGKSRITYLLNDLNSDYFAVRVEEVFYAMPAGLKEAKIAAKITHDFVVCGAAPGLYPASESETKARKTADDVLEEIRKTAAEKQ